MISALALLAAVFCALKWRASAGEARRQRVAAEAAKRHALRAEANAQDADRVLELAALIYLVPGDYDEAEIGFTVVGGEEMAEVGGHLEELEERVIVYLERTGKVTAEHAAELRRQSAERVANCRAWGTEASATPIADIRALAEWAQGKGHTFGCTIFNGGECSCGAAEKEWPDRLGGNDE